MLIADLKDIKLGTTSLKALYAGTTKLWPPDVAIPVVPDGLVHWLDASAQTTVKQVGGRVTRWDDQSGVGPVLAQPNAAERAFTGTRTINGLNAVEFQSWHSVITEPYAYYNQPQPITVILVVQSDSLDGANRQILGNWYGTPTVYVTGNTWNLYNGANLATGFTLDLNPHILVAEFNGSSSGLRRDGVLGNVGTLNTSGWVDATVQIGAANGGYGWSGLLGEFLVYDRLLTTTERLQVENYLRTKWGLP